jgi:hypothetical protein
MSYTGSRVFRSLVVDQGDGTTDTNPNLPQHSCADLGRPNPMEHGEEIHEWPKGTYTVTATAVAHRCGDAQQGADYEDTDNPETASVTLVIKDVG